MQVGQIVTLLFFSLIMFYSHVLCQPTFRFAIFLSIGTCKHGHIHLKIIEANEESRNCKQPLLFNWVWLYDWTLYISFTWYVVDFLPGVIFFIKLIWRKLLLANAILIIFLTLSTASCTASPVPISPLIDSIKTGSGNYSIEYA